MQPTTMRDSSGGAKRADSAGAGSAAGAGASGGNGAPREASASSLGLTIVRTLVGELGGELTVKSGDGTAFELTIPLDVAREATSP